MKNLNTKNLVTGLVLLSALSLVQIAAGDELDRGPMAGEAPTGLIIVESAAGVKEVYRTTLVAPVLDAAAAEAAVKEFVKPENKVATLTSTDELDQVSSTNEAWYYWGVPTTYYNRGYLYNPYANSYYGYGYRPYGYSAPVYGYNPYNYGYRYGGAYYNYYPSYAYGYRPGYGYTPGYGYNPGYGYGGYPAYYYYWRY